MTLGKQADSWKICFYCTEQGRREELGGRQEPREPRKTFPQTSPSNVVRAVHAAGLSRRCPVGHGTSRNSPQRPQP